MRSPQRRDAGSPRGSVRLRLSRGSEEPGSRYLPGHDAEARCKNLAKVASFLR
jgi:hypothetical protein